MTPKPGSPIFLNEPSDDDYIWRYIDTNKLLSFLIERKLYLSRLDQFPDAHEGSPIQNWIKKIAIHEAKSKENGPLIEAVLELLDGFVDWSQKDVSKLAEKALFANCWIIGNRESMAMWSTYSVKDSIAIRIKYKHLKSIFESRRYTIEDCTNYHSIELGKMRYIDLININEEVTDALENNKLGFMKDVSYSHENEFRILLSRLDIQKTLAEAKKNKKILEKVMNDLSSKLGLGIVLDDFENTPFEIIFHPQAANFSKSNIKTILTKLGLKFETKDSAIILR